VNRETITERIDAIMASSQANAEEYAKESK
jgi:hypothetical protein